MKSITIKFKKDTSEKTIEYLTEFKKFVESDAIDPIALGNVLDPSDIWYALKDYYGTSNFMEIK
jgi:hypothetical protein